MNAEEIEVQRAEQDEWVNPFLPQATLPELHHLGHILRSLLRQNGFETDAAAAIGILLDDVHVLLLVSDGVPGLAAAEFVKALDGGFRNGQLRAAFMYDC